MFREHSLYSLALDVLLHFLRLADPANEAFFAKRRDLSLQIKDEKLFLDVFND